MGVTENYTLGYMKLEDFVYNRADIDVEHIKLAVIGLGQAGGKMAEEFSRLRIPCFALNTAKSDLNDLTEIPKNRRYLLGTTGGASKDIRMGREAVNSNKDKVLEVLEHESVKEADYVFVTAGLGGGTGGGGLPTVIQALYQIRSHKSFKGHPTNGVIVSWPGDWEKRGLKSNAVAGIGALETLIDKKMVGSVSIIDNQKLSNDFSKALKKEYKKDIGWEIYGNISIASTLFEIISAISLPQTNAFDRAEFLDVFSTPGYMTIGKQKLQKQDIDEKTLDTIVSNLFLKSNIFADGYTFKEEALIGGFIALRPKNRYITSDHRTQIEETMNNILSGAEITHYGLIDNPDQTAILYSMGVVENRPDRVDKMIDEVEKEVRVIEQAKEGSRDKKKKDLSSFMNKYSKSEVAASSETDNDPFNDDIIFGDDNQEVKDGKLNPFDDKDDL